jgi:hypothetical protein
MKTNYPTPPASAFNSTIKPSNYPFVFMGELNEKHYNNDILERFKGVKKTGSKSSLFHYKIYDWVNQDYYVELKSRNNKYNTYPTTMIGYNKVNEWEKDKSGKKYYFLFGFLDGLYEWELTKENYEGIGGYGAVKKSSFNKGSSYTTFNENKEHLYIPIDKLTKINDKGCLVPDDLLKPIKHTGCLIKI